MPMMTGGRAEGTRRTAAAPSPAVFESLRLRWWTALGLSLQAWRDRRAGLPVLPGGSRLPCPTPCVAELDRRRREVMEAERERVVFVTCSLRIEIRRVDERIRQERAVEQARLRTTVRRELRLAELLRTRAVLEERIAWHCATAQRRAARFDEFMRRCCARYARTLLRRHPDGAELAQCGWPTLSEVPAWVLDPWPLAALLPAGPDSVDGAR